MRLFFCVILTGIVGCSGYSVTGGPGRSVAPSLQSETPYPEQLKQLHLFYLSPVVLSPDVRDGAEDVRYFNKLFRDSFASDCGLPLVSSDAKEAQDGEFAAGLKEATTLAAASFEPSRELARARALGADAMILINLLQFTKRKGSRLAADQSAVVYFVMKVYRSADGKELWRGSYFYKDQAWSENLFKMCSRFSSRPRLGWLEAEEVLKQGALSACRDLLERRATVDARSGE
ncbi:MAG: hypothetical protein GX589_09325 [Deltaproteobacteria bacterium]|nr:hypothetical protein [Deltaproteobacteria bacterium]